ncbi:MAG: flagellar hook-length control protein FliK [Magnetococcales bacterium]|nr:flagellar hook-length control protein FliK [Magnetococcales bacterium]
MTPTSVTASSSTATIDWMAVLSRLSNAPADGAVPSFDQTLGSLLANPSRGGKTNPVKAAVGQADSGKVERRRVPVEKRGEAAASKGGKESTTETRGSESPVDKVKTERAPLKATEKQAQADVDEDLSAQAVEDGDAAQDRSVEAAESAEKAADGEDATRREMVRGKGGDAAHGVDGGHGLDMSGQVVTRLGMLAAALANGGAEAHGETPDRGALTAEELIMQLSLLGVGGQAAGEGEVIPAVMMDAGSKTAAALLPTANMAQLVEKMMQVRVVEKAGAQDEVAEVLGKLQAVSGGSSTTDTSLRLTSGGREVAGGGKLSADSPQFADELLDRVGKMRLLNRGGMTDQLRVTLTPENLGSIDLRLRVDGQHQVHLLITTESEMTKDLLHRQLGQLRDALARQEMGFGEVIVQVGDQGQQDHYAAAQWSYADQQAQREQLLARGSGRLHEDAVRVDPVETMHRPIISASEGVSIIV